MLKTEQLSLARQLDLVFRELREELSGVTSGIVFVQIRNDLVGKFGIRHNPLPGRSGTFLEKEEGLTPEQYASFRLMALESLKFKRRWTHGEISFEFAVKQGIVMVDAVLESNYNMANLMIRYPRSAGADADHNCG